ncbi:YbjQ family protein [Synechococcus sp. PCC 7336]|uniref:YbjQ family protein n=1 Tax=Synechococcus sp. PCC 7336 TaxID=195250 RepID=UPI000349287D|nr:YbjQ family protein [Synechococcus sp. PCC 7336]
MLLTTTDVLQETHIREYVGVVTAEVVYGSNFIRDWFANIREVIGGRTGSYERLFEQGHEKAMKEMEKRARRMGANAVIGISTNTGSINIDEKGVLLLITATGTAVTIED